MNKEIFNMRFHHPTDGRVLDIALPVSTTFSDVLRLLYNDGFLQKKSADYGFIIGDRLCAMNKRLSSYVPLDTPDIVDVGINGMLTIMI